MFFPRFLNRLLVTWFGTGRFPIAPGTAGSLGALPLCWVLSAYTDILFRVVFAVGMTAIAILAAIQDQRDSSTRDPGYVVIDEVAGMLWSTLLVQGYVGSLWLPLIMAFGIFRVLDVLKPFPARFIDRSSKTVQSLFWRGTCIILDDVVAGIYTALILYGIIVYLGLHGIHIDFFKAGS